MDGKDMREPAKGGKDRGQRELQQHRAHGSAKDDQKRGRLQDLAQIAAFDQQPGDDAGGCQ
jgi:hypothetical protein